MWIMTFNYQQKTPDIQVLSFHNAGNLGRYIAINSRLDQDLKASLQVRLFELRMFFFVLTMIKQRFGMVYTLNYDVLDAKD